MVIEKFNAGVYKQQFKYKSFSPTLVNQSWTWSSPELNVMLEKAIQALASLDAYTRIVPNVDLFIEMHIAKEANTSSRIEGTQTNIDEVFMDETNINPEKRDDWREVHNYIKAINYAIKELRELPLSNRLLKKTHSILMESVRGKNKTPGDWRRSQNWIGGSSISDAAFIPPHDSEIVELLSDLEKFWYNEEILVPNLIKIAISHYQFETIHPFLDGNGRIGRLLITLYLVSFGLLKEPSLYLSDFFERHRASYYDALSRVRESDDLLHWVKFFLNAVIETAEDGIDTFGKILSLKEDVDSKIVTLNKKAVNGRKLIQLLFRKPIINASDVESYLRISRTPANNIIRDFQRLGILVEITGLRRNRMFAFVEYLNLFIHEPE